MTSSNPRPCNAVDPWIRTTSPTTARSTSSDATPISIRVPHGSTIDTPATDGLTDETIVLDGVADEAILPDSVAGAAILLDGVAGETIVTGRKRPPRPFAS